MERPALSIVEQLPALIGVVIGALGSSRGSADRVQIHFAQVTSLT
jgi:hypothetical protein